MNNALTSAKSAAQALLSRIRSVGSGIGNVVSNIATDAPTYLASFREKRIGPTITLPPISEVQKYRDFGKLWETSPINALKQQLKYQPEILDDFVEKSGSAYASPRYVAPSDSTLDELKRGVLDSSGFRPAMQRFLSSIPVVQRPLEDQGAWGMAHGPVETLYSENTPAPKSSSWEEPYGNPQRMIFLDPKAVQSPLAGEVLLHEYIHEAPRKNSLRDSFIRLSQSINPKAQPVLWNVSMQYLRNGKPAPNPEEVYATLGQQLGPRSLLIPEVRDFYKNVFSQYTGGTTYSPFSKPELWKNGNLVE